VTRMPPGFRDHVPQAPSASRACAFRDNFNLAYDARTQVVEEADKNIFFGKSRPWWRPVVVSPVRHSWILSCVPTEGHPIGGIGIYSATTCFRN